MKIYADEMFIINMAACFGMLYLLGKLMSYPIKGYPLAIAGAVGAVSSVLVFCTGMTLSSIIKGISFILMPIIAYGALNIKTITIFAFLLYAGGGAVNFFASFFKSGSAAIIRNGITYIDIPPLLLAVTFIICYPIMLFCVKIIKKYKSKKIYRLKISAYGTTHEVTALYDSGNLLKNPYDQSSVIIIEKEVSDIFKADSFLLIPFRSLGTTNGFIKVFKADSVLIVENGKKLNNVSIGICEHSLSKNGKYNALIGPDII